MTSIKKYITIICLIIVGNIFAQENFYWVGGSGDWSDLNHWASSSGGTDYRSRVPGPTDNVFFDANSGFTASNKSVNINVKVNCKNFTVSGCAVPPDVNSGGYSILVVFGSFDIQSGTNWSTNVHLVFKNTNEVKTLHTHGVKLGAIINVEIQGLSLLNDLEFSSIFNFGKFISNGHKLNGSYITNNANANLNIINSEVQVYGFSALDTSVLQAANSHLIIKNSGSTLTYCDGTSSDVLLENPSHQLPRVTMKTYCSTIKINTPSTSSFNIGDLEFEKSKGKIFLNNGVYNKITIPTNNIIEIVNSIKVNQKFEIEGDCSGYSYLQSNNKSIIAPSSATIDVKNVSIKNVQASGGANFVAQESISEGTTTGWSFTSPIPKTLYWVGGSGNWSDKMHWATSPMGVGGACVPGPYDDVFFGANSGFTTGNSTVTLDVTGSCKNITFDGCIVPPTFTQPEDQARTLNIYGSSQWQTGMPDIFIKYVNYKNTGTPKTIKSNGVKIGKFWPSFGLVEYDNFQISRTQYYSVISFEESNAISLLDPIYILGRIHHKDGQFNTSNHRVDLGSYDSENSGLHPVLNLGSSSVYINAISGYFNAKNAIINAGTSHIHFVNQSQPSSSSIGFPPYRGLETVLGQTFYDVTFDESNSLSYSPLITLGIGGSGTMVNFNKVHINTSGKIQFRDETAHAKEFIFTPFKTYQLQNIIFKADDLFSLNTPDCEGRSTIDGYNVTILKQPSTQVIMKGVVMNGVTASPAGLVAENSIDNGNNVGWTFANSAPKDLYWVGGSGNWEDKAHWSLTPTGTGGDCVPGPNDNVFFGANSGFTATDKSVKINSTAYCKNITVEGCLIAPRIYTTNSLLLNIYGNSKLQAETRVSNLTFVIKNTGQPKTIDHNGAEFYYDYSAVGLSIYETNEVNILSDINMRCELYVNQGSTGVLRTNNHKITTERLDLNSGTTYLGSSQIIASTVDIASGHNIHAGTSEIKTRNLTNLSNGSLYDVIMTSSSLISYGNVETKGDIHRLEFLIDGIIKQKKNTNIETTVLAANKTYNFSTDSNDEFTTQNLIINSNPCFITYLRPTETGNTYKFKVTGTTTQFDFVDVKDMNATGQELHFDSRSVDSGNNTNVMFAPYNPASFNRLGEDIYAINDADSSTYILNTATFYGNAQTTYKWYKLDGPTPTVPISTATSIDVRDYGGYGVYKVVVNYSNNPSLFCEVEDTIRVTTKPGFVNPSLRNRAKH